MHMNYNSSAYYKALMMVHHGIFGNEKDFFNVHIKKFVTNVFAEGMKRAFLKRACFNKKKKKTVHTVCDDLLRTCNTNNLIFFFP